MKTTLAVLASLFVIAPALANTYQAECAINLTVQPAGPRTGNNGLRFMNVQGAGGGGFASFGVAEFLTSGFGIDPNLGAVTDITAMTLLLQSNNAAFTSAGSVQTWITRDLATEVAQSNFSIFFDSFFSPDGVGLQFDPKIQAGDPLVFPFTGSGNSGVTFEVPLVSSLDATTKQFLIDQLNDPAGKFRILVTPLETNTMAATFSGFSATTQIGSPPVDPFGPTIRFVVSQAGGSPGQSGTVRFAGRTGGFPTTIDIDFRDTGTLAVQHTSTAPLTATGDPEVFAFTIPASELPASGTYDVALKTGTFLRDSVGARNTASANADLDFDLKNGNITVTDNVVDLDDFLILAADYEQNPLANPNSDLTGDGQCNLDDFLVLAANYEVGGDQ